MVSNLPNRVSKQRDEISIDTNKGNYIVVHEDNLHTLICMIGHKLFGDASFV